jgi:hypothetical protein
MSGYGIIIPFSKEHDRLMAAGAQVSKAQRLQPLTDYRKAGDAKLFFRGPASVQDAYVSAGYWLAVAARLGRSRALATAAARKVQYATLRGSLLPGSTVLFGGDAGEIASVLQGAADEIKGTLGAAASEPQFAAVFAALGAQQKSAAVNIQAARESSQPAAIVDTGAGVATDIAKVADWMRALIPGLEPKIKKPTWQIWALRGVAAAGGLGVLALVLRPYLKTAQEAVKVAKTKRSE